MAYPRKINKIRRESRDPVRSQDRKLILRRITKVLHLQMAKVRKVSLLQISNPTPTRDNSSSGIADTVAWTLIGKTNALRRIQNFIVPGRRRPGRTRELTSLRRQGEATSLTKFLIKRSTLSQGRSSTRLKGSPKASHLTIRVRVSNHQRRETRHQREARLQIGTCRGQTLNTF